MSTQTQKKIIYSKDDLKKLNTYILRTIPTSEKYGGLRKFVGDEDRTNLSNIIKRPMIPSYLKEKYGENGTSNQKPTNSLISRGNYRDQRELSRRKLCVQKIETIADKANEEIRNILSKLSNGNKSKLFSEFLKLEISDDCGQT